ncbi:MAG: DNA topoisomerase IV subunit B [Bacilli bacterium]
MSTYNENSIKVLEGLEAVRKRPGMYIGSTDKKGLHHLIWEIVDNSIDEALNGYGNYIKIIIHNDSSISIEDFGRGVPVGMHLSGVSTPELIYTKLHAGGKFEESGYKVSGGLHGVGASVVNALSSMLKVTINKEGKTYEISFKDGGKLDKKLTEIGKTTKTGTKVHFMPDNKIFKTTNFSFTTICERMQESCFLNKNLTIEIIDEADEKKEVFLYKNGISEFVNYINEEKKVLHDVVVLEDLKEKIEVEIALNYTTSYSENIISFVNNVKTSDGGTHEVGFKTALTRVFNEYAKDNNLIKGKDGNLDGGDVREGLTAIISLKIPEAQLQFEGQTKGKLGTPIARSIVDNITYEKMKFFLEENREIAMLLVEKMLSSKNARMAAKKARENARNGKDKGKKEKLLAGKLTPAANKNKKKNELYLVEGDSAAGSAKQCRDRSFQAILPLRGKVINAEKSKFEEIIKNEEINTLMYAIGAGYGANFDIDDCNYDKVIIMTDADNDGAHIQVLLLTFFYKYMKDLILNGRLYVAMPPLYHLTFGKKEKIYAWSDEELENYRKKNTKFELGRFKGLGEMNFNELWDTTMNPETRKLIRVKINDASLAEKRVKVLMGDKVEPRKEWIDENVEFTLEDDFNI